MMTALQWQQRSGNVECHETQIATTWPEYIRGVVLAQEVWQAAHGYTAYVEYFSYGIARQVWGGHIFADSAQAKTWCESEITRRVNSTPMS